MTYEEFQRALREAGYRMARSARGCDVRIADLPHAVGNSVWHAEFNENMYGASEVTASSR